ncbi:TPA: hypothetical protein EYP13_02220, partial [Candidatus Micrarchaeota archaeon]|nr:hypothetical protein [Candidatus Micrarchaeota archaeon]
MADSVLIPNAVNPDENVVMGCYVEDRDLKVPVEGYEVRFYMDGEYIGSALTEANGWAHLEFNVGSRLGERTVMCAIGPYPEKYYDPYPDENYAAEILNVTASPDTDPPDAVEYNMVDITLGIQGTEIKVYRGDELNFWAFWDENISYAWVEYNIRSHALVEKEARVDGRYTEALFETNADWARGYHRFIMRAKDEANNTSTEENSAVAGVYVWVRANVEWVSPAGTVSKKNDMNAVCRVYEGDTNAGIAGYTVYFYSDIGGGTFLGTAETNADGYATLFVDLDRYYGNHTFWCQILDWPEEYYEADTDYDSETLYIAAVNLKALSMELNNGSPREGDPVEVRLTVWNQKDPAEAWIEISVQRWDGSAWAEVDRNL